MTSLPYDAAIDAVDGTTTSLAELKGKAVLVVNVASRCGLTPQFEQLEQLQKRYAERGLTVIGFPCNQFAGQSPEGNQEMADFCSATYGTTFPIFGKIEVNGEGRHEVYDSLVEATDADGEAGDIQWNFEKFLIAPTGEVVGRFRPKTLPDAPEVVAAIEAVLPTRP
jgi:glutathione peroxidase